MHYGGVLDVDALKAGLVDANADGDGGAVGSHGGQVVQEDKGEGPPRHVHNEWAPSVLVGAVQALGAKSAMGHCLLGERPNAKTVLSD